MSCCLRAGMQFVSSMSQRLSGVLSSGLSPQAALRKTHHFVHLRKKTKLFYPHALTRIHYLLINHV